MAFNYTLVGFGGDFVIGNLRNTSVNVTNLDVTDSPVGKFKFTVHGAAALAPANVTMEFEDVVNSPGNWNPMPLAVSGSDLVGYYPPTGTLPPNDVFMLPGSASALGNYQITFNTGAPVGAYTFSADFVSASDVSWGAGFTKTLGFAVVNLAKSKTIEVDPISRIEGHLGVKLTTDANGYVTEANAHGNLWRGFENFLLGRNPNDSITFVQRICGVCPVPHGTTAMFAVESVYGYNDCFQTFGAGLPALSSADGSTVATNTKVGVPAKALHIRNLVLAAEYLMSSITHFYHLAAPSYVQGPNMAPWTPYFDDSYYHPLLLSAGHGTDGAGGHGVLPYKDPTNGFSADLWSAVINQYVKALRIRRLTFEAGALFAGRMPMTSSFVAGGVTTDNTEVLAAKCLMFRNMIAEVGAFVVKEYVPLVLALGALYPAFDNSHNGGSNYGAGIKKFLSWGAFPQVDGSLALERGYKAGVAAGAATPISKQNVLDNLREDIKYSRYDKTAGDGHDGTDVTDPSKVTRTRPLRSDDTKYSWLKAPRWNGNSAEGGPMARMFVMDLFQDTRTLASTVVLPGLAGYGAYVRGVGLDPNMVSADLAVALLREGLAKLVVPGAWITGLGTVTGVVVGKTAGVDGVTHSIVGLTNQQIVDAYSDSDSYITGVVADWIIGLKAGASTMDRVRGRAIESLYLVQKMLGAFNKTTGVFGAGTGNGGWVEQLSTATGATYTPAAAPLGSVQGFGACDAPRGALMHFISINGGKIDAYQCVVPTTWNASPKASTDGAVGQERGPMEQAMIGIPYSLAGASFTKAAGGTKVTAGGVEALRVAQSFDPCIACAVH